ncbi:AAA family ATPase [Paracoccus aurantiacus]|uniref:non-specific protein-tyrosine kinase n=1 Tax=Paracoccus aurantiacus TaxID=2599412 RepID=A0A5C6RX87_9RHOB|nr:AAA family ATPase [Paracoccus aurantiacus]TXB66429.1 AAA family ATPase [Paracoccus aurantiacus]
MNDPIRRRPRQPVKAAPARVERMDSEEFMQLLRRNIWLILVVVLLVIGGTAAYLMRQTPLYSAQSAMALTNSEVRISQIDTQMEVYDLTRARVETELDRLRSRSFAEDVASRLDLFANTEFLPVTEDGPPLGSSERARAVIDKLLKSYSVQRTGESLVITIMAEAAYPQLAADIANGVVNAFIDQSVTRQVEGIERSTEYLRRQIDTSGEQLTLEQMQMADFIRENVLDDAELPERLRRERSHMTSVLAVMDGRAQGDTAERQKLEADLKEVEDQLAERTRNEMQLSRMERSVDLLSTRYQTMVERLNQLEPQRDQVDPDARQVTAAEVPYEPSWPNIPTTLALALPAGLVLGFILALLRSSMNRQIWTGAQATHLTQLPNLGNIPRLAGRRLFGRKHAPTRFLRRFPRSEFSEAIRSLVTIWSSQGTSNVRHRLAMVTSALPNEGKSTVATSLAAVAALDGQRVLLLDFDPHRAGASLMIEGNREAHPLGALNDGSVPVGDAIYPVPEYENFDVLRIDRDSRLTPKNIDDFGETVLPQLTSEYDLIVIDTPPVLGMADAARVGILADETLVVVRAGKTPESALRNCVERLEDSGVRLSGTVLNDIDPRRYRQMNLGGGYGYY